MRATRSTPWALTLAGLAGLASAHSEPAQAAPTNPGELVHPLETAQACETCHLFENPDEQADQPNHSPFAWAGTMMGNSARDPVFWAGVALAHQDEETQGETSSCVQCHAPRAFLEGRGDAIALDELEPNDREGIACDACHRMVEDPATPPGNAQYEIDDDAMGGVLVPVRGPWAYSGDPLESPPHPTVQDEYIGSSRLCGTCHDVTTPRERVDERGVGMGVSFNEQRTYSEWLNSDYADEAGEDFRSCQDCHMPAVEDVAGCNIFSGEGRTHPTGGRRHDLAGANRFMIGLHKSLYDAFGTDEVNGLLYDFAQERVDEILATAATMDVQFPASVDLSEGISALDVRVTNDSGHKLPTGYSEGRVMWIEVTASYAGEPVWSSGGWDESSREIEADDQVRRYEGIAEDAADGQRNHLLLNNRWVEDTRIPAKGMTPDIETDPVGDRYGQTDGVWNHWDDVSYAFEAAEVTEVDGAAAEMELRVRLLYLINTDEYIDTLAQDNVTNDAGTYVQGLFMDAGGPEPLVLGEASTVVPLTGLVPQGGDTGDETTEEESDGESTDTSSEGDEASSEGNTDVNGDDGGGGCNCATSGRSSPAGWLGLLVLLGLRRRRW